MDFSSRLINWYDQNGRSLPWRITRDPYHIWISEIILQQTRMDQGLSYYHRFLAKFPDVFQLAAATEEQVLRLWQGLGYYSRARNLHQAARDVVEQYGGTLPGHSKELVRLKGIGPYTSAAIASMAFGETIPAIDGNVYRVLSRIFAVDYSIDTNHGKKVFNDLAMNLIPEDRPGAFNQAMMDFGSMICRPAVPLCHSCIFHYECLARQRGSVKEYPLRNRKIPGRDRNFNYFLFRASDHEGLPVFFVQQRTGNDIWKNMYEFPLLESDHPLVLSELLNHPWWKTLGLDPDGLVFSGSVPHLKHQLTHQTIHARFYQVEIESSSRNTLEKHFQLTRPVLFEELPKPRLVERFYRLVNFC